MSRKKIVLLALLGGLLILILLLPTLLSTSVILHRLLATVNASIPGSLSIDSCTVGWRQPLTCTQIVYTDPDQGLQANISGLKTNQGLLALAGSPWDFGTITVDNPVIEVSPRPGPTGPKGQPTAGAPPQKTAPGPAAPSKHKPPVWKKLKGHLKINNGVLVLNRDAQAFRGKVGRFQADATLARSTLTYKLKWLTPDDLGSLLARGFVNLPSRRAQIPDQLEAKMDVRITDLQIDSLLALAALRSNIPHGKGIIQGNLSLDLRSLKNIQAKGSLNGRDLEFNGGFLGPDHPRLHRFNLTVDARLKEGKVWDLTRCDLVADPGSVHVHGNYDQGIGNINCNGQLDLPQLFAQIPHLLRMRQDTAITIGNLEFSAGITGNTRALTLVARSQVKDIKGRQHGRSFAWDTPISLNIDAQKHGAMVDISRLLIDSSFFHIQGKGSPKAFSLKGNANLKQASHELGKLFTLAWTGTGQLKMQLASRLTHGDWYDVDSSIDIDNFSLFRDHKSIVPAHFFSLTGILQAPLSFLAGNKHLDFHYDVTSWLGSLKLVGRHIGRQSRGLTGNLDISGGLGLARLSRLLHDLHLLPAATNFMGNLHLNASGFADQGFIELRTLDAKIAQFQLDTPTLRYADPWVHLWFPLPRREAKAPMIIRPLRISDRLDRFAARGSGWSGINLETRSLFVHGLRLAGKLGQAHIRRLNVADWQHPAQGLDAALQTSVDLQPMTGFLKTSGHLPPALALTGRSDLDLQVLSHGPDNQQVTVQLHGKKVSVHKEAHPLLTGEYFRASAQLQGELQGGDIDLNELVLESRPLTLRATGKLQRLGRQQLELQGVVTPDLARIGTLLNNAAGIKVRLEGSRPESFHLLYPLVADQQQKKTKLRFSSQIEASRLDFGGFALSRLKMPLDIKNGFLNTRINSQINGGLLSLAPRINLVRQPMLLTVADNTQVLTDVQLAGGLTKGIIGKLHPLFGTLARPAGVLSATLEKFSWPLGPEGARQAELGIRFDVSRVKLSASAILAEILHLVKIDDTDLKLRDANITCKGHDGRISCSPVKVTVADSEMVFSGSVGFDKSLDYLVAIPVTRNLVGKEGFRILEGTAIRVPIRGTLDQPSFDADMITAAIGDLTRQAASRAIEKQVEKVVPNLLDKLFK